MILRDGPPRMVARSTWSGRERSSHSRFLPVPRVGLVTFAFLVCFSSPSSRSHSLVVSPASHRFIPRFKLPVFRVPDVLSAFVFFARSLPCFPPTFSPPEKPFRPYAVQVRARRFRRCVAFRETLLPLDVADTISA